MKRFTIHQRVEQTLVYIVEAETEAKAMAAVNGGQVQEDHDIDGEVHWTRVERVEEMPPPPPSKTTSIPAPAIGDRVKLPGGVTALVREVKLEAYSARIGMGTRKDFGWFRFTVMKYVGPTAGVKCWRILKKDF